MRPPVSMPLADMMIVGPPHGEGRDHDHAAPLGDTVEEILQSVDGIAFRMNAVAVRGFGGQHVNWLQLPGRGT